MEMMMGVDRTDYLMLAVDLDFKDVDPDSLEAEIEGAPGRRFDVVYDGMCGKYCLAGKIIAKSDPYEGIEMVKIDPDNLDVDRSDLAAKIMDACGHEVMPGAFSLILFSHFH
jgi:hypothetical protein